MTKNSGMLIAAAAAAFFTSNALQAGNSAPRADAKIQCLGINGCRGQGECSNSDAAVDKLHGCAGVNACKGKGWVTVTAKECTAKGGKIIAAGHDEPAASAPASAGK